MKFHTAVVVLLVAFISIGAEAAGSRLFSVSEMVDQYYANKLESVGSREKAESLFRGRGPVNCDPHGSQQPCIDLVCEKLGTFGCDSVSEIQEVGRMCRGNPDGRCIDTVCNKLGTFGCDSHVEIGEVARACVGNVDVGCFESVCRRLGSFGCDSQSEVAEVLRTCAGF